MSEPTVVGESRDDVLHAMSLYELFCRKTADDFRQRNADETATVPVAALGLLIIMGIGFFIIGRESFAKITFVLFGFLAAWTAWGVIVRSSARIQQKADDIIHGRFPAEAANMIVSRLRWWNHLVSPLRWAKHSRIYERKYRLEKMIANLQKKITEQRKKQDPPRPYEEVTNDEIHKVADSIGSLMDRQEFEAKNQILQDELDRLRGSALLYNALLLKVHQLIDKLERIEKMSVTFRDFAAQDIGQVVSEAIGVLEERRLLVLDVDKVDPDNFISMVSVG